MGDDYYEETPLSDRLRSEIATIVDQKHTDIEQRVIRCQTTLVGSLYSDIRRNADEVDARMGDLSKRVATVESYTHTIEGRIPTKHDIESLFYEFYRKHTGHALDFRNMYDEYERRFTRLIADMSPSSPIITAEPMTNNNNTYKKPYPHWTYVENAVQNTKFPYSTVVSLSSSLTPRISQTLNTYVSAAVDDDIGYEFIDTNGWLFIARSKTDQTYSVGTNPRRKEEWKHDVFNGGNVSVIEYCDPQDTFVAIVNGCVRVSHDAVQWKALPFADSTLKPSTPFTPETFTMATGNHDCIVVFNGIYVYIWYDDELHYIQTLRPELLYISHLVWLGSQWVAYNRRSKSFMSSADFSSWSTYQRIPSFASDNVCVRKTKTANYIYDPTTNVAYRNRCGSLLVTKDTTVFPSPLTQPLRIYTSYIRPVLNELYLSCKNGVFYYSNTLGIEWTETDIIPRDFTSLKQASVGLYEYRVLDGELVRLTGNVSQSRHFEIIRHIQHAEFIWVREVSVPITMASSDSLCIFE